MHLKIRVIIGLIQNMSNTNIKHFARIFKKLWETILRTNKPKALIKV